jgi:peptide/nickel transport system substrate-binding protein
MRRIGLLLLAVSSLLLPQVASAATRPRYGGTLRVAMRPAPSSLDPVRADQRDLTTSNVSRLIFDTLVTLDDRGSPQPGLAVSWQTESGNQRWHFTLRGGVTFQDETPLTAEQVAASLRTANPNWRVTSSGDAITIESDSPNPNLPAELALARNGIVKRGGAQLLGTGPFTIREWDPGKRLTLAVNDSYWNGRPFLNSVEITMRQSFREQMLALDMNRTDLIEISPEQARRGEAEGRRAESSAPDELMALLFARDPQSPEQGRLRQALALSIDRSTLSNVLLQGGGEPAASLLPNWMTGYAFLFPASADLAKAREVRGELPQGAPWTLTYDANDPVARVLAERITLNASDAGLTLRLSNSATADVRLARLPLASLDARLALSAFAAELGLPEPKAIGNSPEDLYTVESMLLQSQRVIPLLHLRDDYGLSAAVKNWSEGPDGSWHLSNVWLAAGRP